MTTCTQRLFKVLSLVLIAIMVLSCSVTKVDRKITAVADTVATLSTPIMTDAATLSATLTDEPTNALSDVQSINMKATCQSVTKDLSALKAGLQLPDHFQEEENPFRQETDFNPNDYFKGLKHLRMADGYVLDYVYSKNSLGGAPVVYARKSNNDPFKTPDELQNALAAQTTPGTGPTEGPMTFHDKIVLDKTPQSYFEFMVLTMVANQFYLDWHANYNDSKIMCDFEDLNAINEELKKFPAELPKEFLDSAKKVDFTPVVRIAGDKVGVRWVTFTKWGGLQEHIFDLTKEFPIKIGNGQLNPLVKYDCGIRF